MHNESVQNGDTEYGDLTVPLLQLDLQDLSRQTGQANQGFQIPLVVLKDPGAAIFVKQHTAISFSVSNFK